MITEKLEIPRNKIQKTFEFAVKKLEKMYDLDGRALCRYYHDEDSVSVDGELHALLNGNSDYLNGGREIIDAALADIGYFMENVNGCDFKFYKI